MKWIQSRGDFRHPKIYSTTPQDEEEFHLPSWVIWLVVLLIVVGAIVWFLFYSDYFKIKNIEINGSLNPAVKTEIESLKGQNIILLSLSNQEEKLANKQTSIKSIDIDRGIPDILRVKVEVRQPKINWKTGDKNYYIDLEGRAFSLPSEDDLTEEEKNNLIKITDTRSVAVKEGQQILTKEFIDFATEIYGKFAAFSGANINEIKIGETTFQIEVMTDKNFYVIFDTTREAEPQLKGLQKVIKDHFSEVKEYIDMRIEGKAYYK